MEAARGGLTSQQVAERHASGQSNKVDSATSRPVSAILRSNIFTLFNAILATCAIAVLAVGDWRDAVFAIVLVLNMAIGIFSELRSKRELDSLAVLQAPTSQCLRDGKWSEVLNEDLVIDDVICVKLGDQIPADGQVLDSAALDIDESALTGESKPVHKKFGDSLMSGTAVVAGSGEMLVEVIGGAAWAQKITAEARKFSKVHSEIQGAIDKILGLITLTLPFMIAILAWSQVRSGIGDWRTAVVFTVAGIVGMIPQGLVLLTSMNFGIASATLARRGVLVQELPAVEVLARVDVLCLDKTGTLTTGDIRGRELIFSPQFTADQSGEGEGDVANQGQGDVANHGEGERAPTTTVIPPGADIGLVRSVLAAMVKDDSNATSDAVAQFIAEPTPAPLKVASFMPFNSARKWAALTVEANEAPRGMHTWVLGAPEILLDTEAEGSKWAVAAVAAAGNAGRRTVCLSYTDSPLDEDVLPVGLQPAVIAVLEEDIRPDAKQTLEYFRSQGVATKIISGDAPRTVGAIAEEVGLRGADGKALKVVDARTLPPIGTDEFAREAVSTDVFGRVTPEQKRGLVHALQGDGYTVAMTGDGVNDALALKDADLGIAMGNAAPATKAVSRLVLVNGEFSVLPGVVAEGRRIIANMERVSSLFLSKTTYAFIFVIVVALLGWVYPLLPRQLTYIGSFTIGMPAFFLSLAPNSQKYRRGFLRRTLLIAVPSGIILATSALAAYAIAGEGTDAGRTEATITLIIGAMALLVMLARPWNWWRLTLVGTMVAGAVLGLLIPFTREFFNMEMLSGGGWLTIGGLGIAAALLIVVSFHVTANYREVASGGSKKH